MRRVVIGASLALASHTLADPDVNMEKVMGKAFMPAVANPQRVGVMPVRIGTSVALAGPAKTTKLPAPENSLSKLREEIFKLEETNDRMQAEIESFQSQIAIMGGPGAPTMPTDGQNGRDMTLGFGLLGYGASATVLVSIIYGSFVKANSRAPVTSMNPFDGAEFQSSAATACPLFSSSGGLRTAGVVMSESKGSCRRNALHDPEPTKAGNRIGNVKMFFSPSRAGTPRHAVRMDLDEQDLLRLRRPLDDAPPKAVVDFCMAALRDNGEEDGGKRITWAMAGDMVRSIHDGDAEKFIAWTRRSPVFDCLVDCESYSIDVDSMTMIPGTQTRGAMCKMIVRVTPAERQVDGPHSVRGRIGKPPDRDFRWTLQQQRRPPRLGAWLIYEVLAMDYALNEV